MREGGEEEEKQKGEGGESGEIRLSFTTKKVDALSSKLLDSAQSPYS